MPSKRLLLRRYVLAEIEAVQKILSTLKQQVNEFQDELTQGDIKGSELFIYRQILYPLERKLTQLHNYLEE